MPIFPYFHQKGLTIPYFGTDEIFRQLSDRLQEDGLRTLCCLLAEHMSTLRNSALQAESPKLVNLSSCNVSIVLCAKQSDGMDGDALVVQQKIT